MRCFVLVIIIAVEIVYLIGGGFVFWALESPRETQHKQDQRNFNLSDIISNFSVLYPCVSFENLTNFVQRILEAERNDLLSPREPSDWDIHGSIFFAMTVVTTIGYGNVTPKTIGGKIFCCFYAIVGIPFTMVMLLGIGDFLKAMAKKIRCPQRQSCPRTMKVVSSASIATIGVVLFLVVPAAIFTKLEGWSYGTAIYYGVITTATIGFGDYVAAWNCVGSACWFYRISVGIWIYLGLAWLAGVISTIQDWLEEVISKAEKSEQEEKKENETKPEENGTKEAKNQRSEATNSRESETTAKATESRPTAVVLESIPVVILEDSIQYESARL